MDINDDEIWLASFAIRKYLGKDYDKNKEIEIMENREKRIIREREIEENLKFLELYFDKFLDERLFSNNVHNNFLTEDIFPLKEIDKESNLFRFNFGSKEFDLKKLNYSGGGIIENEEFKVIYHSERSVNFNKGVCSEKKNNVLILPFFDSINFYKPFNVFICERKSEDLEERKKFLHNIYYFDTKGRFLKKEKGHILPSSLPNIAVINNKIIEINTKKFGIDEVYNYNLFKIYNYKDGEDHGMKFQLIDNKGNLILDKNYYQIIKMNNDDVIFALDKDEIVCFDFIGNKKRIYNFNKIEEVNDNYIKVSYNSGNQKTKYSIINSNGKIALKKTYDFIEKCNMSKNFIFFEGNEFDEHYENEYSEREIVQKKIDKLGDYGISVLFPYFNGKFGVINEYEKVIIPCNYNWIEELEKDVFLLNKGGKVFHCSTIIDDWNGDYVDEFAIHKGEWIIYNTSDNTMNSVNNLKKIYKKYKFSDSKISAYKIK